jgi:hypothetical protein
LLGFEKFYLYFDPCDPGIPDAKGMPGVEVVIVDDSYRAQLKHHAYGRHHAAQIFESGSKTTSPDALNALQLCNMATGLDRARKDGIRWLLHIDIDELFHPGDQSATEHFRLLDAVSIGQARYINHEAIPNLDEHNDYFREVTLFKRNAAEIPVDVLESFRPYFKRREGYFHAYDNGKCAVRTLSGVTPATVHGFRLPVVALGRASLSTPCILHYPFTSFERYWAKLKRLGDFKGELLLGEAAPRFLLTGRDLARDDQREKAWRKYRRVIMYRDQKRTAELLAKNVLIQVVGPAKKLAEPT